MSLTLRPGQMLAGRVGSYTIVSQLQESVWMAVNHPLKEHVIVKYVNHFRLQNERDILLRFQGRTPHIRPLIDEVKDRLDGSALILKYLDDDVLHASSAKRITQADIKTIGKSTLQALQVLHDDGFVHTDIKPSNVLVNYDPVGKHITDVQLADFGSTVHQDSLYARDGDRIGTPIFRSPEAHLQMPWNTATDVWSFGTMLISLLYGSGFHIFKPDVPIDHKDYDIKILIKHHRCFGPFPESYQEIADQQRLEALTWIMQSTPRESLRPFHLTTNREISEDDKQFLLKIMKLDPRDRPTVRQLLADEWFNFV